MKMLMIDDRVPRLSLGAGYPRAHALIHGLLYACERFAFYPLVFPTERCDEPDSRIDARVELLLGRGNEQLTQTLVEYADRGYDVLWVSRPPNMRDVVAALAEVPGLRERFTIVYDAEALYAARTAQLDALVGKPSEASDLQALYDEELTLAGSADLLVSVSASEAQAFRSGTGRPTIVLGFTSSPQPTSTPFAQRRDFGFAGGIRSGNPNEDSLLWYVANVMYELQARTGALFRVAGFVDSPWVIVYNGDSLVLHGAMESLQPFFAYIRVFVAPTRYAAGLPQKLIDAASAGVPIVATPLLADALGWRHERELLVAGTATEFTAACERLYRDEALWKKLRANALAAVSAEYGPAMFERQIAQIVAAVADLRAARAADVSAPRVTA